MLPTRMIKKHMADLEGPDLDQLLVSLYQHHQETQQPVLARDKTARMERFESWLHGVIFKKNEEIETMKVKTIFAQELPKLRAVWERIKVEDTGEEEE